MTFVNISPISSLIGQHLRYISPHQEAHEYNGDDDSLEQDDVDSLFEIVQNFFLWNKLVV